MTTADELWCKGLILVEFAVMVLWYLLSPPFAFVVNAASWVISLVWSLAGHQMYWFLEPLGRDFHAGQYQPLPVPC